MLTSRPLAALRALDASAPREVALGLAYAQAGRTAAAVRALGRAVDLLVSAAESMGELEIRGNTAGRNGGGAYTYSKTSDGVNLTLSSRPVKGWEIRLNIATADGAVSDKSIYDWSQINAAAGASRVITPGPSMWLAGWSMDASAPSIFPPASALLQAEGFSVVGVAADGMAAKPCSSSTRATSSATTDASATAGRRSGSRSASAPIIACVSSA